MRWDYHVSVESMFYSVPYEYINRQVQVRLTENLVEIYFNHMRIASDKRLYGKFGQLATTHDYMPENHKLYVDQTPENAKDLAKSISDNTVKVVNYLMENSKPEKLALQSILSLKKTERRYSKYEIERAWKMIISLTARPSVKSIQTFLANNKKSDAEQELKKRRKAPSVIMATGVGAAYYGETDTNE